MFLTYLMLIVALCLSVVAAFYSIIGLTAIFAAAVWPIVIMGTILEAAKLVVTVWLHEYWRDVKLTMKIYLVPAVFILMVITSMGIFGFLSKAHLDQVVPTGDVQAQVALIDEKIANERDIIANTRTLLGQLDKAVTDISNSTDQEIKLRDGTTQIRSSAERALQVRRQQARDRAALTKTIEESQARIVALQEEKAPFAKDLRKIEAEVGPVKYIAALIYGDNPDANLLEKAVRWVIIILVIVFDPLAIMMLLAFTESLKWERERRALLPQPEPEIENDKPHDDDNGETVPRADPGPDDIKPISLVDLPPAPEKVVDYKILDDVSEPDYIDPVPKVETQDLPREETTVQETVTEPVQEDESVAAPVTVKEWHDFHKDLSTDVHFGINAPDEGCKKGDLFVKLNSLPTTLFKYNGEKWIEVNKNLTDRYVYNDQYINFLIHEISQGKYDPELLTDFEREQIEERLRNSDLTENHD